MKRLKLCLFLLVIFPAVPIYPQSQTRLETQEEKSSSMLELCFELWKRSEFGWDEKQTERAAWIVRDEDGKLRWLEWPYSPEYRAALWKDAVPESVVAQIHTHPAFNDPKPSKQDIRVAGEIGAPVYTISGLGIWRVGPNGNVTKEADEKWYRRMKKKTERTQSD